MLYSVCMATLAGSLNRVVLVCDLRKRTRTAPSPLLAPVSRYRWAFNSQQAS